MNATVERIGELMERGVSAGTTLLDTGASLLESLSSSPLVPKLNSCSCEIPPPCWMPRELRPVTSHVCAGAAASLRIRVTNCSPQTTTVSLEATGADKGKVKFSPASISLGPLERGVLTATLQTDAKAASGTELEALIWVRGCVDHVVRWTVKLSSKGGDACHELDVDDCPDYLHHWYDHFYCYRPCRDRRDPAGTRG
jgi:hypothetical protein